MRTLRNNKGVTLAEMLLAVMLLLIVTAIVSQIVPIAQDAYTKIVDKANADLLASTTISQIRNELDLAKPVEENDPNALVTYVNGGSVRSIVKDTVDGNGTLKLREYMGGDVKAETVVEWDMLSDQTRTGLSVEIGGINYVNGVYSIVNLKVKKADKEYVEIGEFKIKAYNTE